MTNADHRPFLIRRKLTDGTTMEYDVHGIEDLRTAAVLVFEGAERSMDGHTNISTRRRFDPYTGVEDAFDPDDYRGIAEIEDHVVSSLPDRVTSPKEVENDYDRAAFTATMRYAEATGTGVDFESAMTAVMRGLIDLADREDVDMIDLIANLGNERTEHGRDETPRLLAPYFKSLSADLGGDIDAAREALEFYVAESGIEGAEDPYVGCYHFIYGIIESAEQRGIDFTKTMALLLEAAEHDPMPTIQPRV